MNKFRDLKYIWNKFKQEFKVYENDREIATMYWKEGSEPKLWISIKSTISVNSYLARNLGDLADYLDEEAAKISSVAKVINELGKNK